MVKIRKNILLVEDDAITAMLEQKQLYSYGYNVDHVFCGEKAVNYIINQNKPVDLILMDIDLGKGIDGTETARRILEQVDIPIVFLSSHTEPEVVDKTERITSYGYVVKQSGITILDASIKMAFKLFDSKQREKEKELTLQKNITLLNKIAENYPNSYISIIENDLTVGFTSGQEFYKQGLNPKDFIGLSLDKVFGKHKETVQSYYMETFKGKECSFELHINNQYQLYKTVPLYSEDGNIHQILIVVENITERKLNENKLHFLSSITEESIDSIIVTDTQFQITYINKACEKLFGYSKDELIGKTPTILNAEQMSDSLQKDLYTAIMNGDKMEKTWKNIRKDGSTFYCQFHVSPLLDVNKKIYAYIGIQRDVTEQKKLEEQNFIEIKKARTLLELLKNIHSSKENMFDYILEAFLAVTESKYSFFGLLSKDESIMQIYSWSKDAMDECSIKNQPMHFPVEQSGILGDCIRLRKTVIYNNYSDNITTKHGTPEGHVKINRYMGIPVFEEGKIIAIGAVANKELPYEDSDSINLTTIYQWMWDIIKRSEAESSLHERIKELQCFYKIGNIIEKYNDIDTIIQETLHLLQETLQFPEITGIKITYDNRAFMTDNFKETDWNLSADLMISNVNVGCIKVVYLEKKPVADIGPFSKNELNVLNSIAERLSRVIERIKLTTNYIELFNTIYEGIIFADSRGIIQMVNPAGVKLCGYENVNELQGKPMNIIYADPSKREEYLKKIINNGGTINNLEFLLRKKDGSTIWTLCNICLIKDKKGNVTGSLGAIRVASKLKNQHKT